MLIAMHDVRLYAHYNTWSEALCSMLRMERSYMLYAIHGVTLCAHCYIGREGIFTLSEAL